MNAEKNEECGGMDSYIIIGGFKARLPCAIAQALAQIHIRKHHFFGVPNFIEKSRTRHTWECVVDNREREREKVWI